jgi:urea transport system permease protein
VLEPWAGAVLGEDPGAGRLILFIQRRPRGLFPQKAGRRRADAGQQLTGLVAGRSRHAGVPSRCCWRSWSVVPVLHLACRRIRALYLSTYTMTLIGKYMTYALLAVAVDLVWGYCGILSLGHAAFFALGGYAMGMYLMRQIGTRGVYGDPTLPDFMVFLNYKELPWFWHGFDVFWFAMVMVALVPGLLALVFGWLAFRSRVTGVYLSIITQALTYALMLAFFRNDMGFGGNNGMTDFKDILGFSINAPSTRVALFTASALALIAGYLACRAVTLSRAGARSAGHPRCREPYAFHRLSGRVIQVVDLHVLGRARRHRRRAVRAAGGHHQSERVPADQLHRDRDLGGGGWTRHVVRRGRRRGARQLRQDLLHRALPEVWLYALGACSCW